MNKCTSCGAKLREGAKFCYGCGTRVVPRAVSTPTPPPVRDVCPTCGVKLRTNAKFCAKCGTKIKEPVSASATAPAVTTSVTSSKTTTVPSTTSRKTPDVCVNCGSILRGGSKYCLNCGTDNSEVPITTGTGLVLDKAEEPPSNADQAAGPITQEPEGEETDSIVPAVSSTDPAVRECFEGLEEIRYYVKDLDTDVSTLTATTSLYSGPLGDMRWKFDSSGIKLATTGKTKVQRNFDLELKVDHPVSYQYSDPFAGVAVTCSDDITLEKIKRESRIAEKISKTVPPITIKAIRVGAGQVDIKITAALEKKNISTMFNLVKDLGWFFDITLR